MKVIFAKIKALVSKRNIAQALCVLFCFCAMLVFWFSVAGITGRDLVGYGGVPRSFSSIFASCCLFEWLFLMATLILAFCLLGKWKCWLFAGLMFLNAWLFLSFLNNALDFHAYYGDDVRVAWVLFLLSLFAFVPLLGFIIASFRKTLGSRKSKIVFAGVALALAGLLCFGGVRALWPRPNYDFPLTIIEEKSYYSHYEIEGDEVRIYYHVVIQSHHTQATTDVEFGLSADLREFVLSGLLRAKLEPRYRPEREGEMDVIFYYGAEPADGSGERLRITPGTETGFDVVFIGKFGGADVPPDGTLPEFGMGIGG